jgi:hypothetical protein
MVEEWELTEEEIDEVWDKWRKTIPFQETEWENQIAHAAQRKLLEDILDNTAIYITDKPGYYSGYLLSMDYINNLKAKLEER